MTLTIRPARTGDDDAIWRILEPVFRAGDTYCIAPDISRDAALDYWNGGNHRAFVAEADGAILGTFYLCANKAGGGIHVANAGFATAPEARGRGIARAMCERALSEARAMGFRAMQFNFVVSTNTRAIALWEDAAFASIGRLPGAFLHPTEGYVDALVMYRQL